MLSLRFGRTVASAFSRSPRSVPLISLCSIFLAGCASTPPVVVGHDDPASPSAERGYAEVPTALEAYKSPADFAARSSEPAKPMEEMPTMPGMPGMEHGGMPGMSGGGTKSMPGMPGMSGGKSAPGDQRHE